MKIKENIERVFTIIENKKNASGVFYPITVVAITKTHPASVIREAITYGIKDIGENRVQEAEAKFSELQGISFTRHMVGHLQENKVNKAAVIFDFIQSIDSLQTAERLNKKLMEINKKMPVLIEVNTSGEESKFGIKPEEAEGFTEKIFELPYLMLKGLMTIGPLTEDKQKIRRAFSNLYNLRERLKSIYKADLSILSMGMSDDFEIAIEEGSNMLRLGRILFGERNL